MRIQMTQNNKDSTERLNIRVTNLLFSIVGIQMKHSMNPVGHY